jgi:nucleoporin SEH1
VLTSCMLLNPAFSTILSSAGNDGRVRLWKATVGNVWRPAGHISVEQAEEQRPDIDMDDNAVAD